MPSGQEVHTTPAILPTDVSPLADAIQSSLVLSGHGGRQAGAGRRCARPGRQACEGSALEPRQRRSTASERGMLEQRRALRQDSDQGTQEDVAHGAIRKPEPVQSRPVRRRNDLQSPTDGRWCVFRALGPRAPRAPGANLNPLAPKLRRDRPAPAPAPARS
jgi:hypothetical protein